MRNPLTHGPAGSSPDCSSPVFSRATTPSRDFPRRNSRSQRGEERRESPGPHGARRRPGCEPLETGCAGGVQGAHSGTTPGTTPEPAPPPTGTAARGRTGGRFDRQMDGTREGRRVPLVTCRGVTGLSDCRGVRRSGWGLGRGMGSTSGTLRPPRTYRQTGPMRTRPPVPTGQPPIQTTSPFPVPHGTRKIGFKSDSNRSQIGFKSRPNPN